MDPIAELKAQVIEEFLKLMEATNLGLQCDYSDIMDKISFIEYSDSIKNADFIYQYLKNN